MLLAKPCHAHFSLKAVATAARPRGVALRGHFFGFAFFTADFLAPFFALEDLALDVVGRTVARVSAEEHMANYQAARALMGKGNSELRNSSRAGFNALFLLVLTSYFPSRPAHPGKYHTSGIGRPLENRLLKIMEKVFMRS